MDANLIQALGDELFAALADCRSLEPLTSRHPGLTLADAYAIQQALATHRFAAGERLVGHKIGVTSQAVMNLLGVDQPDFGQLLASMVRHEGSAVPLAGLIAPRAEAEVAFVLRHGLRGPGVTTADVLRAADYVMPCFEIVDSRIRDWKIRIQDTVADNASCGLLLLGDARADPRELDLAQAPMVLEKNDERVSMSTGACVQGSPLNAVAWLANTLGRLGMGIEAGEIVLSGSQSPLVPVVPGDRLRCTVGGLGTACVRFE